MKLCGVSLSYLAATRVFSEMIKAIQIIKTSKQYPQKNRHFLQQQQDLFIFIKEEEEEKEPSI